MNHEWCSMLNLISVHGMCGNALQMDMAIPIVVILFKSTRSSAWFLQKDTERMLWVLTFDVISGLYNTAFINLSLIQLWFQLSRPSDMRGFRASEVLKCKHCLNDTDPIVSHADTRCTYFLKRNNSCRQFQLMCQFLKNPSSGLESLSYSGSKHKCLLKISTAQTLSSQQVRQWWRALLVWAYR